MNEPKTYTARLVFPVAGPPIRGGSVTVRGDRIEAVSPKGERTADHDLGNVAIIPGLVNAYTHLDLSGAWGLIPPTDPDHFTDWLRGVIAYRRSRTPEQTQDDIRDGLAECLQSGTTLIGDIAAEGQSWDALAQAPTRTVVFRELIGLKPDRVEATLEATQNWYLTRPVSQTCFRGISPHAPYSASVALLLSGSAAEYRTAIHLAESPAELELIRSHTGPFVDFLTSLGVWDPTGLIRHVDSVIIRNRFAGHALYIHGNYLDTDAAKYFHNNGSLVYCPRTHAAFKHPPHPFREFLDRGVRVCLGTDSLASNPDLDIFAEAQFLRERYPDFPPDQLLRMVTLSGADALGWSDEAGSLEPGKSADFVAMPLPERESHDPYTLLFASEGERRTLFRGEWRQ